MNPATDLKDKIWWMSPETHLEINKIRAGKEVFKSSRGETAQLSFMDMLPDSDEVGPPSGSRTDQKR